MTENANTNVFELISSQYYDLTTAEKKIADLIISDPEYVQQTGISDLAEACGTATATVSRFSRKLGFANFSSMRIAIAYASNSKSEGAEMLTGKISMDDSFENVCKKLCTADMGVIPQTLELADEKLYLEAVELLLKAGKVLFMGQGGSSIIAAEAAHLFSTVGGKFFAIQDNHLQAVAASNLGRDDVVMYFSYSGAVRDVMETLPLASARGAKVILITRFPKSPAAELADVVLQCGSSEGPFQLGSVPARISQLFMLDILFSEYCRRDYDNARSSRERIAAALADKHLE